MRTPAWLLVPILASFALPAAAHADNMDIALGRLSQPDATNPSVLVPDNNAWTQLMSQLGASEAPPILSPARTLGYGGFNLSLEGWITGIDNNSDYWQRGTEGDQSAGMEGRNRFVDPVLIWSRIDARKGFPFGFELGTSVGHLLNTNLWTWGLEIKWALLEGFRTGFAGVLPDVAVRGMVQTMTGSWQFNLTIPSIDVVLSKPFAIVGSGTITPILAGQMYWVLADSELVDFTPATNQFSTCAPIAPGQDGMCTMAMGAGDYDNNGVFQQLRAVRYRLAFGVQGRYAAFTGTATFQFDLNKPGAASSKVPASLPRQWTVAASVGVSL